MITIAIGDIHGCLGKLEDLLAHCQRFLGKEPVRFVCIGDYVDRGPDSRGVVQRILDAEATTEHEWVCLKGNHEDLMFDPLRFDTWLYNGGDATLESYDAQQVIDIPREHYRWLSQRRLYFDDGRRFFVHAGIDPSRPLDQQDEDTMLWTRKNPDPRLDLGRLIVHGHTPVRGRVPELTANRLNIDTGAVYGGPLTAAVFDDAKTRPIAFVTNLGDVTEL